MDKAREKLMADAKKTMNDLMDLCKRLDQKGYGTQKWFPGTPAELQVCAQAR